MFIYSLSYDLGVIVNTQTQICTHAFSITAYPGSFNIFVISTHSIDIPTTNETKQNKKKQ